MYHTGKSNQAGDTLSHHSKLDTDISSNAESEEYKTISHTIVSYNLTNVVNGIKLPIDI